MPDNNVNISPLIIPFNPTEATYQVAGAQTTITRIDIAQVRDIGVKTEEVYDWLIGSSGAAGPQNVDIHHRSIRLSPDPSNRIAVPSWFTSVLQDDTSKLNAFIRLNYNNDIDLDVFFSYSAGAGLVTYDAYFWTVELPPGSLETPLDNIPNDFAHIVAIPLRQDQPARRYIIIGLALP